MSSYRIIFSMKVTGTAEVEADSEEEAEISAKELECGDVDWNWPDEDDFKILSIEEEK